MGHSRVENAVVVWMLCEQVIACERVSVSAGKSFRLNVTIRLARLWMAAATCRSSGSGRSMDGIRCSKPVTRQSRTWAFISARVRASRSPDRHAARAGYESIRR